MFMAKVQGTLTASMKHPTLRGARLLIIQPVDATNGQNTGIAQIAIDTLGAGVDTLVLVTSDGRAVQEMLKTTEDCPARLAIVAIVDSALAELRPQRAAAASD